MGILNLFFPKMCLGCGREGKYLCPICIDKVPKALPVCPYCKHPSINGVTHINCQRKLGLDGLTSVWKYEGIVRKAVTALKYKYATEVGKEISKYLESHLKVVALPHMHSLVPIPLYWHKENVRGFNQSVELGGNVAENLQLKFMPNLLVKKISTVSQAGLSKEKRRKNLQGSFALSSLNSSFIIPDSIFLFDDVYTTGSTLFEATKVLKRGGVKKVWGLTIAR